MQQAFHRQKKICPSPAVTHLKTLSIFQGVYTEAQSRGVTGVLAAQLSPRCFRGDPPSASFGHVPICLFVGLSAFRGAVTILTWTHFHECQQPVLFLILGSSQVATGAKRRSFFFFFPVGTHSSSSRGTEPRQWAFSGLLLETLPGLVVVLGRDPVLPPGFLFLCL